jgi:1,4-alpha-glucan branching enzyme
MKHFLYKLFFFCLIALPAVAQLSWSPSYPSINDTLTIIYDASKGNSVLTGVSPVYMHTGVVNEESINLSDWQHKVADWGTDDSTVLMQSLGNDYHKMIIPLKSFYGISSSEKVNLLAFVFRNADGTLTGKNSDGSDIFIPVYDTGFSVRFTSPLAFPLIIDKNETINITVSSNETSSIKLYENSSLLAQTSGQSLSHSITPTQYEKNRLWFEANNGSETIIDSIYYIVQPAVTVQDPPSGTKYGINYINDSTVILSLFAPYKNFVYVIGDFTDWELDPSYMMNQSSNGEEYWLKISSLNPQEEYRFQYLVDADVKIADPYCDKILDPFNDAGINSVIYPDLIDYPEENTTGMVSVLQTDQTAYNWNIANFQKPDKRDLVIYELLIRDFIIKHDYTSVKDSLGHLQQMGINAIELMPVMEFDGNDSWGYAPNLFLAPDKYYGTKEALKALIDEAHNRGIAVILDIVFNHAYGECPLVKLYYNRDDEEVTSQNLWFNVGYNHPYSLGFDFNHASTYTQQFVDSVLSYWLTEYKVDGFRFDLSKGFTNYDSGDDVGLWGQYDASRISYLKHYADKIWNIDPNAYVILEHFADNSEEIELSDYGMMLWGKANYEYNQASMGYQSGSDFSWAISSKNRGWSQANLIGFMESHDEERLMYNNITYGDGNSIYSTQDTATALARMEQAAAFFLTVPGPKMIWQFGELGYDYPIEYQQCRTCKKPIKWSYKEETNRLKLYKIYSALIKLKTSYLTFQSSDYDIYSWYSTKQIHINHSDMNVTVIGNFDLSMQAVWTGFQHTGYWYDYFSGDSLNVSDVNMSIDLFAGEYRIYTDTKLSVPDISSGIEKIKTEDKFNANVYPNPFSDQITIEYPSGNSEKDYLQIYDLLGKEIRTLPYTDVNNSTASRFIWDGKDNSSNKVKSGIYFFTLTTCNGHKSGKIILK